MNTMNHLKQQMKIVEKLCESQRDVFYSVAQSGGGMDMLQISSANRHLTYRRLEVAVEALIKKNIFEKKHNIFHLSTDWKDFGSALRSGRFSDTGDLC